MKLSFQPLAQIYVTNESDSEISHKQKESPLDSLFPPVIALKFGNVANIILTDDLDSIA
jgi:hypothetical protein